MERSAGQERVSVRHRDGPLVLAAGAVIVALLWATPGGLLDKVDRLAYAVCHRIPEHSFAFAGRPLPLCARCSGTYLGALAGLIALALRGRGRAGLLPRARWKLVCGLLVLPWAVDGFNSFLSLLPGLPHLYEPHNLLRLTTGTLEGLVIAVFLLPVVNMALWARPAPVPSLAGWRDLAALLAGGAVVAGLVGSGWPALLYPLALAQGLSIALLVGAVNTIPVLILLHREGQAQHRAEVVAPLLAGLALGLLELTLIGLGRAALSGWLGLAI